MPVETTIPNGEPGRASFASETFGNAPEPRFGDTPAATTNISVTAGGTPIVLSLYSVLNLAGTALADYNVTRDAGCANFIAAQPINIPAGQTKEIAVYRSGMWDMDALVWDASYDTEAKKKAAFEGSLSPTIFVGKKDFNSGAIYP